MGVRCQWAASAAGLGGTSPRRCFHSTRTTHTMIPRVPFSTIIIDIAKTPAATLEQAAVDDLS